jgi:hypothetical protein
MKRNIFGSHYEKTEIVSAVPFKDKTKNFFKENKYRG